MKFRILLVAAIAAGIDLGSATARAADPNDYLYLPAVTYGEHEIDFKAGRWTEPGGGRLNAASIGYGYGVTQNWFTEVYAKYKQPGGESTNLDAFEWENKFQLTEPGQYPVDVGWIVELERPKDRSEGTELRVGPLFQTESGRMQFNGNALFTRNYGADAPHPLQAGYQWQAKYRWQPLLEFGVQGFGEVGKWNHWDPADQRTSRIGPALFGKLDLGGRRALRYNAAWLTGHSAASPTHNLRVQLEYEF